jgi:hypothetical protein
VVKPRVLAAYLRDIFIRKLRDDRAKTVGAKEGASATVTKSYLSLVDMAKDVLAPKAIIFIKGSIVHAYLPTDTAGVTAFVGYAPKIFAVLRSVKLHFSPSHLKTDINIPPS